MVNNFAIGLTHLLLAYAAWQLVRRADLDRDPPRDDGADPRAGRDGARG